MLRDADPSSFSAIYVVCAYTDMRYGMDTLSAIIETRYHLPLFVPNTLFLFCGRRASKIKGLLWEGDGFLLFTIIKGLQLQLNTISSQLEFLTEQIALMNQRSFGRKTEKADQMHQLSLFDVFNEPEFFSDDSDDPEVAEIIVSSHTRKPKTLRKENLKGLPVRVYEHELKKEELDRLFPNGYKEMKPVVYKRLSIIPQTFLVDEHRIHQYTSKDNDGRIIKAKRSPDLFRNSIATASLVAAIINGKFNNHLPLEKGSHAATKTVV